MQFNALIERNHETVKRFVHTKLKTIFNIVRPVNSVFARVNTQSIVNHSKKSIAEEGYGAWKLHFCNFLLGLPFHHRRSGWCASSAMVTLIKFTAHGNSETVCTQRASVSSLALLLNRSSQHSSIRARRPRMRTISPFAAHNSKKMSSHHSFP